MPAVIFFKTARKRVVFFQFVPNLSKLLILVVDVTRGFKKGDFPASTTVTSWFG